MKEERVIEKEESLRGKEKHHPSFGSIQLSKITCGNRMLFGSSISHDNMIALKIKEAVGTRQFNEDGHSAATTKPIIEVYLSPLQFSEMLTTMNYDDGIPCTINYRDGENIKYPEEMKIDKLQEWLNETGDVSKELRRFIKPHIDKVVENIDTNKSLGKNAQKELLKDLNTVFSHLGSNSKFFMDQFTKYMDKTIIEAKATIDSHVDTVVKNTGLKVLRDKKLLGLVNEDK